MNTVATAETTAAAPIADRNCSAQINMMRRK
jgi:hypothetical protein